MKHLAVVMGTLMLAAACGDSEAPRLDLATSDRSTTADRGPTPDLGGTNPESGPAADQGAPANDTGTVTADKGAPSLDKAAPTPDKAAPQPDQVSGVPKILDNTHTGWTQRQCGASGCHDPLPVANHTATSPPQCAACHGANGACNPNGVNSNKKNHNSGLNCTNCHGSKHSFSAVSDCVSCHFAAAGTQDCP